MAYGSEIVLGFRYENWIAAESGLEFKMPRPVPGDPYGYNEYEAGYFDDMDELSALGEYWSNMDEFSPLHDIGGWVDALLLEAWKNACNDMGWEHLADNGTYLIYNTPLGQRKFSPWGIEFFYDPYELGDQPQDGIIGVAISGRYFPTFLDWRNTHGTISNLTFGPNPPKEIIVAHNRISEVLPCFAACDWIIREKHY